MSITRWDLFSGILPPLTQSDWENYFALYKKIPEFQLINFNMTLDQFKVIFLWEYAHRLLGRVIGLFYFIPLAIFSFLRCLNKKYILNYYLILFLIVLQGVVGWYMVKSGLAVTTDVMVGFPGETDSEFDEGHKFCEEMEFAAIHVFPYSQRPGTSSAYFANQVDSSDKTIRVKRLISVGDRCSDMFRERLLGSIRPVLWEEKRRDLDGRGNWFGLTDNYIRVVTESPVTLGNKITPVHLFELRDGMVAGSVI